MAKRERIREFHEGDEKSVNIVARTLTMQEGFSSNDWEDIKQTLYQGLFQESRKFRSRKASWNTFRWSVLRQLAGRIRRERLQPSHRYMNAPSISLNQPLAGDGYELDDYPTLMDLVTSNHTFAEDNTVEENNQLCMIVDVRIFLTTLPPELKNICDAIIEHGLTNACNSLKMTRRTFFRRLNEIRKRMLEAGLDEYLKNQDKLGDFKIQKKTLF